MKEVAVFKKVSKAQFGETMRTVYPHFDFNTKDMDKMYETIQIPKRATYGSVGYDFVAPFSFKLYPGHKVWIPSGIRVEFLEEGWFLGIFPKSRTAKTSIRFSNTIGIVDPDYYFADNEGHIMITLEMPDNMVRGREVSSKFGRTSENFMECVEFAPGDGIAQGIFIQYGIAMGEDNSKLKRRTGGHGSTGR